MEYYKWVDNLIYLNESIKYKNNYFKSLPQERIMTTVPNPNLKRGTIANHVITVDFVHLRHCETWLASGRKTRLPPIHVVH